MSCQGMSGFWGMHYKGFDCISKTNIRHVSLKARVVKKKHMFYGAILCIAYAISKTRMFATKSRAPGRNASARPHSRALFEPGKMPEHFSRHMQTLERQRKMAQTRSLAKRQEMAKTRALEQRLRADVQGGPP